MIFGLFFLIIAILCTVFYTGHNKKNEINDRILKEQADKKFDNNIFVPVTLSKTENIEIDFDLSNPADGIIMIDGQHMVIGKDIIQKLEQIGFLVTYDNNESLYQGQQAKFDAEKDNGSITIIVSAKEACAIQRSTVTEIIINAESTNRLSVLFPGGIGIVSPISKIKEIYGEGILYETETISQLWYENSDYTLVVSYYTSTGEIMEMRYCHALQ